MPAAMAKKLTTESCRVQGPEQVLLVTMVSNIDFLILLMLIITQNCGDIGNETCVIISKDEGNTGGRGDL